MKEEKKVPPDCTECGGEGFISYNSGSHETCPVCKGTGSFEVYSREDCVFRYCDSANEECKKADHCHHNPPPSQQSRSVSQPGKEKRIAIIGAGPKAKALLLAQRMFNKLHEPDAQFADPPQPSQLGESYNVRKEIDWHNANVKMVCELEEELATLRAESQAKDTRIKELEKENKKLLRYWVLHNPEMPPGFGHPENGD